MTGIRPSLIAASRRRFNPLSLSPALWLSDTGSDPGVWPDISGNLRHATQSTPANQPAIIANALNGRQVRRFDGINDGMFSNGAASVFAVDDLPISVFIVAKSNVTTGFGQIISATNTTGSILHLFRAGNAFRYALNDGTTGKPADGIPANTSWNIHSVISSGTVASVWTNATLGASNADVNVNTLSAIDRVGIGISGFGNNPLNGDIAEILIFPTALSTADRQKVESYLSNKWAIALA